MLKKEKEKRKWDGCVIWSLYGVALIGKKSCTKKLIKLINDKMERGKYAYEVIHELELTKITTKTAYGIIELQKPDTQNSLQCCISH